MSRLFDVTPEFRQSLVAVWNSIGHDLVNVDGIESNADVVDMCINSGCFEIYGGEDAIGHMLEFRRLMMAYGYQACIECIAEQVQLW
jgi:hypothetical protein